jgi:hypothetical protein
MTKTKINKTLSLELPEEQNSCKLLQNQTLLHAFGHILRIKFQISTTIMKMA